ncbi:hypothetical protein K9M06_05690 [Candidatus Bipolaricaulota bacterium]|nr:hypothetical protein [Candidatus Bipolaricaulota bacterium]
MKITSPEVIWFFFQAIILGISIIGLDWDARHEGFSVPLRLVAIGVLIVTTIFFGAAGPLVVIILYWFYSRRFRKS